MPANQTRNGSAEHNPEDRASGSIQTLSGPLDHGELNVPPSKRYGKGGLDAAIDRYKADAHREARHEHRRRIERRKAAREAEARRPRLTLEDVEGATHVRDQFKWHRVVRVNTKSVTVETGYSWTDRISFDRVLEARTISAQEQQ